MPYFCKHALDRYRERVRHTSKREAIDQLSNIFEASSYSHTTRDRGEIWKAGSMCFMVVGDSVLSVWIE